MWKSTSELGYASGHGDDVASMAWKLHAIEQTQLRRKYRVDGVGRPKFDFHAVLKREDRMPPRAVRASAAAPLLRDDVPAHARKDSPVCDAAGRLMSLCGGEFLERRRKSQLRGQEQPGHLDPGRPPLVHAAEHGGIRRRLHWVVDGRRVSIRSEFRARRF